MRQFNHKTHDNTPLTALSTNLQANRSAQQVVTPRRLALDCPHCFVANDVDLDCVQTSVTCRACGNSFQLVDRAEETQHATALQTIAHFELLERLGMGAFATVWKARDLKLNRTVALKIPRMHVVDAVEEAQFLREAQTVAALKHPHIVAVHDIVCERDTLYIVSDLVQGLTLADRLSAGRIAVEEAARISVTIADALHYAHGQGVVHRDIKPANIMLDQEGRPHVMDFGLAKRDTSQISISSDGQVMGTPAYMSPELAAGNSRQVDGRSDVFSLGVMLFEMISGELPFRGQLAMLIQQIIHEDPPRPSTFNQLVPRDLDTICLKSLEKAPDKRYASAAEFASDLRRFLAGEPIRARPANSVERGWRWCLRNRLAASLAGIVAVSLVVLATVSFTAAVIVNQQKQAALVAANDERIARRAAERAESDAEQQRIQAEQVVDYMVHAFGSADPDESREGRTITVAETLRRSVAQLDSELGDQPLVRAELLSAIGRTYLGLGLARDAEPLFQASVDLRSERLGPRHAETLEAMANRGSALYDLGRNDEAIALFESILEIHSATAGPVSTAALTTVNSLSACYLEAGQLEKATLLLEDAIPAMKATWGDASSSTLRGLNNLGAIYHHNGRYEDAIEIYESLLPMRRKLSGEDSVDTFRCMQNLASAQLAKGLTDTAIPMLLRVVEGKTEVLGAAHPETLAAMNQLAVAYEAIDQLPEAAELHEQALALKRDSLGPSHPSTLTAMNNLASTYARLDRGEQAIEILEEALPLLRLENGPDHPSTLSTMNNLAMVCRQVGQLERATELFEETLRRRKATLPEDHPGIGTSLNNLALTYMKANRVADAVPLFEQAVDQLRTASSPLSLRAATAIVNLGHAYASSGHPDCAVPLYEEALAVFAPALPATHPSMLTTKYRLATACQELARWGEAVEILQPLAVEMRDRFGPQAPATLRAQLQLGRALLQVGQLEEAETWLTTTHRQYFELDAGRSGERSDGVARATAALITLYESSGRQQQADRLRSSE